MGRFVAIALICAVPIVTNAYGQAPSRSTVADSAGPSDQIICRRFLRTGTLADFYRVCKTRGEWDRERQERRELNSRMACKSESPTGQTGVC